MYRRKYKRLFKYNDKKEYIPNIDNINGNGVIDTMRDMISSITTPTKYEGERHLTENGIKHNFSGPGTDLKKRRQNAKLGDYTPINKLDSASKIHDLDYERICDKYKKAEIDKNEALEEIWNSDKKFIEMLNSENSTHAKIAKNLINMKMKAEKNSLLSTKIFSGIGYEETKRKPNENLKKFSELLQKENNKKKSSKKKSSKKKKELKGGIGPLAIALITTLASSAIDYLLKKYKLLPGSGQSKIMTLEEKRNILAKHVDNNPHLINDILKFE